VSRSTSQLNPELARLLGGSSVDVIVPPIPQEAHETGPKAPEILQASILDLSVVGLLVQRMTSTVLKNGDPKSITTNCPTQKLIQDAFGSTVSDMILGEATAAMARELANDAHIDPNIRVASQVRFGPSVKRAKEIICADGIGCAAPLYKEAMVLPFHEAVQSDKSELSELLMSAAGNVLSKLLPERQARVLAIATKFLSIHGIKDPSEKDARAIMSEAVRASSAHERPIFEYMDADRAFAYGPTAKPDLIWFSTQRTGDTKCFDLVEQANAVFRKIGEDGTFNIEKLTREDYGVMRDVVNQMSQGGVTLNIEELKVHTANSKSFSRLFNENISQVRYQVFTVLSSLMHFTTKHDATFEEFAEEIMRNGGIRAKLGVAKCPILSPLRAAARDIEAIRVDPSLQDPLNDYYERRSALIENLESQVTEVIYGEGEAGIQTLTGGVILNLESIKEFYHLQAERREAIERNAIINHLLEVILGVELDKLRMNQVDINNIPVDEYKKLDELIGTKMQEYLKLSTRDLRLLYSGRGRKNSKEGNSACEADPTGIDSAVHTQEP
jgi:hypothetical protein